MIQTLGRNLFSYLIDMSQSSFRFRQSDKKRIWMALAIIVTTLMIVQCFNFFHGFYIDLLFMSGGVVWLPVILSYIYSFSVRNKEYDVSSLQRHALFLFAAVMNVISFSIFQDPESAGLSSLFYLFFIYPAQVVIILIIDLLLFLVRKSRL